MNMRRRRCTIIVGILLLSCFTLYLLFPIRKAFQQCYVVQGDSSSRISLENICVSGSIIQYWLKPTNRYFAGEIIIGDFICKIDERYPLPINMLEDDHSKFTFALSGNRHGGSIASLLESDQNTIIGIYDSTTNQIILHYRVNAKESELFLQATL